MILPYTLIIHIAASNTASDEVTTHKLSHVDYLMQTYYINVLILLSK